MNKKCVTIQVRIEQEQYDQLQLVKKEKMLENDSQLIRYALKCFLSMSE